MRPATAVHAYRSSTSRRPRSPHSRRRAGSSSTSAIPAARSAGSCGVVKRPGMPSRMTWWKPMLSAQTTGVPLASASSSTTPNEASTQGHAKTSASR